MAWVRLSPGLWLMGGVRRENPHRDSSSLRVLHLYPKGDFFTGAAIQVWDLVRGLQARGHDIVLATRPDSHWASRAAGAGVTYYGLPMSSELDLRSVLGLIRVLRRHRIQIVHAHKGRARTLILLAGLFADTPVLLLNRGVSYRLDRFNRLGYTTRRVTAIIAVCEAIKASLVQAGVPEAKIHVIYSGTDTERFHPGVDRARIRDELGLTTEQFLVTQIGVRSEKGNDDLMEAMATVTALAPSAHLLMVGARDPQSLYARAQRLGLKRNFHVLGYREDVPEILAGSSCCVDASYRGLGLTGTLRESLAVATPVVATAIEGNPELVIDGETGLLVPPRDVPALARAITRVMSDPVTARQTAEAGRRRVQLLFSTRRKVERVEALYRELVAAHRQQARERVILGP
jgi:glycosyltransferase involved in cell wall biosynthesis